MTYRVFVEVPHPGLSSGLYGSPRDPVRDEMLEALREAELQIVYLQDKFQETGTGNAVLARIAAVIAKAEGK